METRKEPARAAWLKPTLVRKPVQETLGNAGSNQDGQGGEFPLGS